MMLSLCRRRKLFQATFWLLLIVATGTVAFFLLVDQRYSWSKIARDHIHGHALVEQFSDQFTDSTDAGQNDADTIAVQSSSSIDASMIQRQIERRRHLASECEARLHRLGDRYDDRRLAGRDGRPVPVELYNLVVDDERKFLYCQVPKVACTNWRRVLLYLSGALNVTSPEQLTWLDVHGRLGRELQPRLHRYTQDEIEFRLRNYFKFIFVRDPLDRILSAYNDKFGSGDNALFNQNYGRRIIRTYRANATAESLEFGNDVTLAEFVQYLLDPATRELEATKPHWYGFEQHWREMDDLCHPCFVGYDFVGKYETLAEDVEHVMKLIGIHGLVEFPGLALASSTSLTDKKRQRPMTPAEREDFVRQSYAGVTVGQIRRLLDTYSDDYRAFDYPYPSFIDYE